MTDPIFFDTDCLSAFLWVGSENLIVQLYKSRIMLPQQVYEEVKRVPHLLKKIDALVATKNIILSQLVTGTPEANLYVKLSSVTPGYKFIGKGEASAIALAKYNNGILGSNNLKDIQYYIDLYELKHVTTGDILVEALSKGLITESHGNSIWVSMINKKRKLPTVSFSDFLATYHK
jgi:predicted nucleic acid-binding protein